MEVRLLSNGKFSYFPKFVYMDIFKLEQIIKMSVAGDESAEDVLTECLDGVIDFGKTGIIKSSSELCSIDRIYLILKQRIEISGSEFNISSECRNCGYKNNVVANFSKMKEIFLEKCYNDDSNLGLVIPSIKRVSDILVDVNNLKESDDWNLYFNSNENGEKILNEEYSRYLLLLNYISCYDNLSLVDRFEKVKKMDGKILYNILNFINRNKFGLELKLDYICSSCKSKNIIDVSFFDVRNFF